MSRLVSAVVGSLLLAIMAGAQNVSPAPPASKQISDLRTVFLINTNADQGVFYHISATLEESGRWKIVGKREEADLLLVLSERRETTTLTFNPNNIFFNVYYLSWPTRIEVDTLSLAGVDRDSGRQLFTVSCARHRFPSASKFLVSRLSKWMEKDEKPGE